MGNPNRGAPGAAPIPECIRAARTALALGAVQHQPAARRRKAEAEVMSRLSMIDHRLKVDFQRGRLDLPRLGADLRALADEIDLVPARVLQEVEA